MYNNLNFVKPHFVVIQIKLTKLKKLHQIQQRIQPGCSKTLSFHIVKDLMKGSSSSPFFRAAPQLQDIRYQGSEKSTSTEIDAVFQSAIRMQTGFQQGN